jgi:hypothetical protein
MKEAKTTEYGIIYATTEYDKFKFLEGNRKLRLNNLEKMRESMIEEQLVIPICVNENFEIIDGQHRFTICKELNKPVYYYVQEGYGINQVERANRSNTNWQLNDFLQSFALKGNSNYQLVGEIIDTYNVLASDVIKAIAKLNNKTTLHVTQDFKEEKVNIDDELYNKLIAFFEALTLFEDFNLYNKTKFISSFLDLYTYPKYNHDIMVAKFAKLNTQLKHCTTKDDYLDILCNKIYSGKRVSKDNIYYNKDRKEFYQA